MDKDARTLRLIGPEALARIQAAHVVVLGLGGVGGHLAEALARAGVGRLTLVDGDVFAESNLNRQIGCLLGTVGLPKAQVMAERVGQIDPRIRATAVEKRIVAEDLPELLSSRPDYVADAIDDVNAKVAVAVACREQGIPLLSCMGAGNRIGTAPFEIGDIFATEGDPLARVMRQRLRKAGVEALRVCWSREAPYAALPSGTPASISTVPGMAGLTMAGAILRDLGQLEGGIR